jgi:hypothetical protein
LVLTAGRDRPAPTVIRERLYRFPAHALSLIPEQDAVILGRIGSGNKAEEEAI